MSQLFYDPKGATVTLGTIDAGQAVAASLTINVKRSSPTYEWDADACRAIESTGYIFGIEGDLTLELMSAADLDLMAVALFGEASGSVVSIGDTTDTEWELTVASKNRAASCDTYTYNFPRVTLADSQEHIFGVAADATDPTYQRITFRVLLAEGSDSLGSVTKS
jgi:hypothetical protein